MNNNPKEKICYIVGAGEKTKLDFSPASDDLIIAADGGYEYLAQCNITPQIAVGDFDSLGYVPSDVKVFTHPAEKDETDTFLAVKYAYDLGFRRFVFFCCMGNAFDHSLANVQVLNWLAGHDAVGFAVGNGYCVTCICQKSLKFDACCKGRISVFALGGTARCSLKGLKYQLDNALLSPDFPLGVSNEFCNTSSTVTSSEGIVAICFQGNYDQCELSF